MAVEGGSTAPALPLPPRLSASSPPSVGMLLTRNPSKNPSTEERRRQGRQGRRLTGEKAAEDKLAAGARRRHPPLSARRQLRPVPRRPPLSASIRIGSGGWEVGI